MDKEIVSLGFSFGLYANMRDRHYHYPTICTDT